MIIALAILLAAGAKEFAIVNKLFTGMVCFEILIWYHLYHGKFSVKSEISKIFQKKFHQTMNHEKALI